MPSKRGGGSLEHQSGDTLGVVECDPASDQARAGVSGQDRSFNPERVGSYRLRLPEAAVRVGDNALTLVPDTRVRAAAAGPRFAWLDPDMPLGVRFWYLRVLE